MLIADGLEMDVDLLVKIDDREKKLLYGLNKDGDE